MVKRGGFVDVWMMGKAFLVGGGLCVVGQVLINHTKWTPARILVGFVVAGVALTAIGVYEPLVQWAGCGGTVPLTGFGYALAQGVKEAVEEKGLLGAITGGLTATAAGVTTAVTLGLIAALVGKSGDKT
jgi:stage V sporulation protein AE